MKVLTLRIVLHTTARIHLSLLLVDCNGGVQEATRNINLLHHIEKKLFSTRRRGFTLFVAWGIGLAYPLLLSYAGMDTSWVRGGAVVADGRR